MILVADCTHLNSRRKRSEEHTEKLACSDPEISDEDQEPYAVESWMVHGALNMAEHLAKDAAPVLPSHASNIRFLLHALSLPMYQRINEMAVALLFEAPG